MSNNDKVKPLKKGYLIISLDVELAWGRIDNPQLKGLFPLLSKTMDAINSTHELFDKYSAPATWAVVGRLVEDPQNATTHYATDLNTYFPTISSSEIYSNKELHNEENSFVSQPKIIEQIKSSKIKHEIATHSYNHIFFQDIDNKDLVKKDLIAAKEYHEKIEYPAKSIVFPKNQENHFDLVKSVGIECYRGVTVERFAAFPKLIKKIFRQIDAFLPLAPATIVPYDNDKGLLNIPGTFLFRTSSIGFKRFYPVRLLSIKGINGIKRAIRKNEIQHLWWHPFNFGFKTEIHLKQLEKVLAFAEKEREKGKLEIITMREATLRFKAGKL